MSKSCLLKALKLLIVSCIGWHTCKLLSLLLLLCHDGRLDTRDKIHFLQVLVIFLGDMRFKWLQKDSLLPFQKHRQQKTAEADALIASKQLTKPILFNKALKVRLTAPLCALVSANCHCFVQRHAFSARCGNMTQCTMLLSYCSSYHVLRQTDARVTNKECERVKT